MSLVKRLFIFTRKPANHRQLFDNVLIISVWATFIFTINAFLVLQNTVLGLLNLFSTFLFTGILYLSKIISAYRLAYRIYSTYIIIVINAVWFIGGGFDGFNGYIMMLLLTVLMVIREKIDQLKILFFIIFNVIVLFIIEYRYPDLPRTYDEPINTISQGIVLIISLITLYYFIHSLKRNYQAQKEIADMTNTELSRKVEERTLELKKANEDLINKNIKLDQFTSTLAHNLRGPVARIKGLSEVLRYNPKGKDALEGLEKVKESILDLDQVLSDLQTILDIQRGNKSGFEQVDIQRELNKCLSILESDIHENNIEIRKEIDKGIMISGYKAYFQSVLYNLISNAIKFSSADKDSFIRISAKSENGKIRIEVEDNGIGIEMKYADEKIFKLYQRFHNDHPGKGVGLYLVKTQVEAMHGTIELDSKLHEGTRFTIKFNSAS